MKNIIPKNTLTIDISSTNCGYIYSKDEFETEFGEFYPNSEKITEILTNFREKNTKKTYKDEFYEKIINKKNIILETPKTVFKGTLAFAKQKEVLGAIKNEIAKIFIDQDVEIFEIQANQWKKFFTYRFKKGSDHKLDSLDFANNVLEDDKQITSHDIADAICMFYVSHKIILENKPIRNLFKGGKK